MMESDGGSNLAFVNENQLFCYHAADKKMAYLFSFYEEKSGQYDIRTIYDHHGIKILNVDETEINMDTTFVDDLGADSLDVFQIIMGIEEELDIEVNVEEAEKIVTVGDAVELIKKTVG